MVIEQVVRSELHLDRISHKPTRDTLRRAAKDAGHGPVWIMRTDGTCMAAMVPPDEAAVLWLAFRKDWDQLLDAIGGLEDEKLMALEEAAKTLADAASEMLGRRP